MHANDLSLLTAAIGDSYRVSRILDQEPEFLRFVEEHGLVPGRTLTLVGRDSVGDSVTLRAGDNGIVTTLGARTAAKVLVRPGGE